VAKALAHEKLIGQAIRKFRKAKKITQEQLAERADLHPVYMGQIERGEQAISVRALIRIAQALGVRLRDLVRDL